MTSWNGRKARRNNDFSAPRMIANDRESTSRNRSIMINARYFKCFIFQRFVRFYRQYHLPCCRCSNRSMNSFVFVRLNPRAGFIALLGNWCLPSDQRYYLLRKVTFEHPTRRFVSVQILRARARLAKIHFVIIVNATCNVYEIANNNVRERCIILRYIDVWVLISGRSPKCDHKSSVRDWFPRTMIVIRQ